MRSILMRFKFFLLIALLGSSQPVVGQLSDNDLNRLLVLAQRVNEIAPLLNSGDEATQTRAAEQIDPVIKEMIDILRKDPAMAKQYDDFLKQMEEETRRANEEIEQRKRNRENQSTRQVPPTSEIRVNSTNTRQNPYEHATPAPGESKASPDKLYQHYVTQRQQQGDKYRSTYQQYVALEADSFEPSDECRIFASLNASVPVSQQFTKEPSQNSIGGRMKWSQPTTLPGTKIKFQYSLLYYCKTPAATLGDQISAVMDDYGFVRIINGENVTVRGKIEFDFIDFEGNPQTSMERFVLEPGAVAEELGMWYLACKFKSVRLVEVSCK